MLSVPIIIVESHRSAATLYAIGELTVGTVIEAIDRIRVAWDQFFSAATDSRMRAETRLSVSTSTQ